MTNLDMEQIMNLSDYSPEQIAQELFTNNPKNPCTHQILALQNNADLTYIFEILLTVLMEGIDVLINGFENLNLNEFNHDHILIMQPWFWSLGFKINLKMHYVADQSNYEGFYCRIVVKAPQTEHIFTERNLVKGYHFFINPTSYQDNCAKTQLNDLKAVFTNGDTVYEISFDKYTS